MTVAVDVRSGEFFDAKAVAKMIGELRQMGNQVEVIFMEASDETLLDRYKETRREHPLCQEGLTLTQAIAEERTRLQPLREIDIVIAGAAYASYGSYAGDVGKYGQHARHAAFSQGFINNACF